MRTQTNPPPVSAREFDSHQPHHLSRNGHCSSNAANPGQKLTSWRVAPDIRRQISDLARGLSLRAVAEQFGIDKSTVRAIKREFGIPANPRGGPRLLGKHLWATGNISWPCRPRPGLNPGGIRL